MTTTTTTTKQTDEIDEDDCKQMLLALRWRVVDTLIEKIINGDLSNAELIQVLQYFEQ